MLAIEFADRWEASVVERVLGACRTAGGEVGLSLDQIRSDLATERRKILEALFTAYLEVPLAYEACGYDDVPRPLTQDEAAEEAYICGLIAHEAGVALRRVVEDAVAIARGRGWVPRRREIPSTIRTLVYRRDGYACVECGRDDVTQLTLDHRHPLALGGTDDSDNLRTLCRRCNTRKGAQL